MNFASVRLLFGGKTRHWNGKRLRPVSVEVKPLGLLKGIDEQKRALLANTSKFAEGRPALNAFLWGARGMGKSSLIKAVTAEFPDLYLVGMEETGLATLPGFYGLARASGKRFILFLDELTFAEDGGDFHPFKSMMEGGVVSAPPNVLFYVTSNHRRIARIDDSADRNREQNTDSFDDKTALSDRFGLRLGFHHCTQELWEQMVKAHVLALGKKFDKECLRRAERWSIQYGGKSGRAAELFAISL